jgi:hypothetical protein
MIDRTAADHTARTLHRSTVAERNLLVLCVCYALARWDRAWRDDHRDSVDGASDRLEFRYDVRAGKGLIPAPLLGQKMFETGFARWFPAKPRRRSKKHLLCRRLMQHIEQRDINQLKSRSN